MRRALGVIVVIAVLVLAWFVWAGMGRPGWPDATAASASGAPTSAPPADTSAPARPADAFPLTVDYVYDGDTIRAVVDEPNDIVTTSNPIKIRIIGIDTPEGTPEVECWADEARTHLSRLLPEGSTVWAAPDRDTWDDYGRRLFGLWTDDGRFVAYELVAAGDAEAIRVWPNVAWYDGLSATEAQARAARLGQWAACG